MRKIAKKYDGDMSTWLISKAFSLVRSREKWLRQEWKGAVGMMKILLCAYWQIRIQIWIAKTNLYFRWHKIDRVAYRGRGGCVVISRQGGGKDDYNMEMPSM